VLELTGLAQGVEELALEDQKEKEKEQESWHWVLGDSRC
jgi:hypothetical protein